jgi:putative tryptophan/tyrosine transport system substrate-binding protein
VKRRELVALLGGAAVAWPLNARAQQKAMPMVVGSLAAASFIFDDDAFPPRLHAAMQAAGWQRGRDYRLVVRSGDDTNEAYPALVRELIALQPSVIVPFGDGAIRAVQAATTTIPVSAIADDMVGSGLVASMAHPGGNTTGVSILASELDTKRLGLLHEAAPNATRLGVLADPTTISTRAALERGARQIGVDLLFGSGQSPDEMIAAINTMADAGIGGLNVLASPLLHSARAQIMAAAARHHLPAIYQWPEQAGEGGLLAYGPRLTGCLQLLAEQTVRVLQGGSPADLPVQQPTTFELAINLKTAKTLGVTYRNRYSSAPTR